MIKKPEYVEGRQALENFENTMDALMKVPHGEIKAKLEAEKAQKRAASHGSRRAKGASREITK